MKESLILRQKCTFLSQKCAKNHLKMIILMAVKGDLIRFYSGFQAILKACRMRLENRRVSRETFGPLYAGEPGTATWMASRHAASLYLQLTFDKF